MGDELLSSEFLKYLVANGYQPGDTLPTLATISREMAISVGKLREQIEHARQLGLISVRPRIGIERLPFDFAAALAPPLAFSLMTGEATFRHLSEMRRALEIGLWREAACLLQSEDFIYLRQLVRQAQQKLQAPRIQIPHKEHREFHLTIFRHLDNPYVLGVLAAYWDAYEAFEITAYERYAYWSNVWRYHEQIIDLLAAGETDAARDTLIDHFNLLKTTPEDVKGAPLPATQADAAPS